MPSSGTSIVVRACWFPVQAALDVELSDMAVLSVGFPPVIQRREMPDQQRPIGGRLPACIAGNAPSICHRSSSAAYLWLQWNGCRRRRLL